MLKNWRSKRATSCIRTTCCSSRNCACRETARYFATALGGRVDMFAQSQITCRGFARWGTHLSSLEDGMKLHARGQNGKWKVFPWYAWFLKTLLGSKCRNTIPGCHGCEESRTLEQHAREGLMHCMKGALSCYLYRAILIYEARCEQAPTVERETKHPRYQRHCILLA